MKIGSMVKVKKYDLLPGIVGDNAEIVGLDLTVQGNVQITAFPTCPVYAKMLSGEHKGKTYGFQLNEVEIVPTTQS